MGLECICGNQEYVWRVSPFYHDEASRYPDVITHNQTTHCFNIVTFSIREANNFVNVSCLYRPSRLINYLGLVSYFRVYMVFQLFGFEINLFQIIPISKRKNLNSPRVRHFSHPLNPLKVCLPGVPGKPMGLFFFFFFFFFIYLTMHFCKNKTHF